MSFSQIHIFWTGWRDISRFSWPIDLKFGADLHRMYLYRMNHEFQNLMLFTTFSFFFTTQKTKSRRKMDILTSKYCHFFNFRNFAVSMVHAIFEMHFSFLISTTFINFVKKEIVNTLQVWINLCAKTAYQSVLWFP